MSGSDELLGAGLPAWLLGAGWPGHVVGADVGAADGNGTLSLRQIASQWVLAVRVVAMPGASMCVRCWIRPTHQRSAATRRNKIRADAEPGMPIRWLDVVVTIRITDLVVALKKGGPVLVRPLAVVCRLVWTVAITTGCPLLPMPPTRPILDPGRRVPFPNRTAASLRAIPTRPWRPTNRWCRSRGLAGRLGS